LLIINKAERGIIGKSRYATRLRQEIKNASSDRTLENYYHLG
jgi:hypothetical protein